MSLVGPRPALDYELQYYKEPHYERFAVKPGMTGLWQVSGRNELGFTEMLDLDAEYARSGTFLTDLKILVKTPGAAISGAA
jgi:exopolysaccharide production protein ExoY